ncbi:MAG: tetratricopeptide repeat protein [Ktedonobacterales bacterium]
MGQTALSESLRTVEAEIAGGQAERALAHCQELLTRFPRALAIQRVMGEAYLALRKTREAIAALDRTLTGDPEDARAYCARAIVHQMHGDAQQALTWYHRACDARPEDQSLRATYREMATSLGQPGYRPSRVGLARLYLRGDQFTHAIREWETLLAEHSDLLEAQAGLVETLWRAGRLMAAEEWGKRLLANAPTCMKPLLITALIALDGGRTDDAQRLAQRATELDPDHRFAQALFADRLATGDTGVRLLVWGSEADAPQPLGIPANAQANSALGGAPNGATTAASMAGGVSGLMGMSAAQTAYPSAYPSQGNLAQGLSPAAQRAVDRALQPGGQTGERKISRPLVDGQASSRITSTSLGGSSLPLPPPPMPTLPTGRPSALPANFSKMFEETAGMLWTREPGESDPNIAGMEPPSQPLPQQPGATPPERGADTFARSSQFVPPAIAQHGSSMEDTEARMAINWVQWLQAQGARSIAPGSMPNPMAGAPSSPLGGPFATMPPPPQQAPQRPPPYTPPQQTQQPPQRPPVQPSQPLSQGQSGQPSRPSQPLWAPDPAVPAAAPTMQSRPSLPSLPPLLSGQAAQPAAPFSRPSGPLAQPAPNVLRSMFAELEPETQAHGIIDAEVVVAAPPTPPISQPLTQSGVQPQATLEAMDRQLAASGFQPFTPQPGTLAALANQQGEAQAQPEPVAQSAPGLRGTHVTGGPQRAGSRHQLGHAGATTIPLADPWDISNATSGELPTLQAAHATQASGKSDVIPVAIQPAIQPLEPLESAPAPLPTPLPAPQSPTGPDPKDYPARLARAREQRDAGNLDAALVEYGAVLRNAPDLLPDVTHDLDALLDESPEHPELHKLVGDARIRQGDYFSALESINRSVSLTQAQDASHDDQQMTE